MAAIGIDLGTTYSCVGVVVNDKVEILKDKEGEFKTPSCVSFNKHGVLVGKPAKLNLEVDPKNTVSNVKRIMGLELTNLALKSEKGYLHYDITEYDGSAAIKITAKGDDEYFYPEEISGKVLAEMKRIAENFLGKEVKDAVITIPARFNNAQREKTREAAKYARLNVLRLLHEPTAAAIAYGLQSKGNSYERKILVYDLGGGTFDVSILRMEDGIFDVMATSGDSHLGGEDFDQRMVADCLASYENPSGAEMDDIKVKYRLRRECEKTKQVLSRHLEDELSVEIIPSKRFTKTFTRAKFERMNKDYFEATMRAVERALKDAKLTKDQIDDIVVVGGSSRIPYIRKMLKEYFEKDICTSLHPDQAVASGAAIFAAQLSGNSDIMDANLDIRDVIPLSLGIKVVGGIMSRLLERNTKYPTTAYGNYTTVKDNQTEILFCVYEGESAKVDLNHLLGSFALRGIPPQRAEEPSIKVSFDITSDGLLKVSAIDQSTENQGSISIEWNKRSKATQSTKYQNEKRDVGGNRMHTRQDNKATATSYSKAESGSSTTAPEAESSIKIGPEMLNWLEGNPSALQFKNENKKS